VIKGRCHEASILLALQGVQQHYRGRGAEIRVLDNIDFTLYRGQTCAIFGGSGSGKSTLLNILGLLERPAAGYFRFAHQDVMQASSRQLAHLRNREIGFVFQAFNLLPRLNALDNVALPLRTRGLSWRQARMRAAPQLERVGLEACVHQLPADLSGGQRQRVAIARALVGQPRLILADEPTGNLDSTCTAQIMALLLTLNREHGVSLVMVTHDDALAGCFQRCVRVVSGHLFECSAHAGA